MPSRKARRVALLRHHGPGLALRDGGQARIASIKDLKGKIICIGGLVDINRVYLERIMRANGLHDGDYDITVVGNTAGRFAALKSGTIDATLLSPPVNFFAEDAGFRNVAMVFDYAGDLPFSAMDVSLAYAAKHGDALTKLLAAIDRSIAWFNNDAHRDEAIDILAAEMKSQRDPVARSYDYFRKIDYFAHGNQVSRAQLQGLIKEMKALGDIKSDITAERVVMPGLTHLVDWLSSPALLDRGFT